MNIDNSIGMALFSGELSSAAANGGQQGQVNGAMEGQQGSLFQQMINQMLTGQGQTTVAACGDPNAGEQNKSGGAGDLLSELLLAGGNLSKAGLLKTGKITGEAAADIKGASEEKQESGENGAATDMLQALMAGMTNTAVSANVEKAFMSVRTGAPAESQLAAVDAAVAVSGNPAVSGIQEQTVKNPALQTGLNETTVQADGRTEVTETVKGLNAAQMGILQNPEELKQTPQTGSGLEAANLNREKAETNGIALQTSEKTVPANDEADRPSPFASQNMLTQKAESGSSKAASEILIQDESAIQTEKLKQETAAAEETDPAKSGFQNSVQGAVTTNDIAESGMPVQTVESPQPYSQIREEILNKLEQNGPTEFKMQLQPEDLGQIDIKLKLSEGKLVIDILAADSRTQALLTSQVDKLISSMGLQNVQVESVQVSQQMNSQTQDNSQSQGFTMNSAMDFSQRRQEQNRQEILNNGRLAGTFSQQQDETQTNDTMSRIESIRFNNHRMNYSV